MVEVKGMHLLRRIITFPLREVVCCVMDGALERRPGHAVLVHCLIKTPGIKGHGLTQDTL